MNGRKKVTVVGAGNVGATCALEVARRDYADVVLVDIVPNFAAGKALDMNQMASVTGYEPTIVGSEGYAETKGSDVVVITAGTAALARHEPRRPRHHERGDRRVGHEGGRASLPEDRPRRRLEPARRDVPRRAGRLGVPEGARRRHGGHPRHGALLGVHRLGDRLVGEGRAGDGARRPRRPDGPRRLGDDGRRRAARAARRPRARSRRWSSGRGRAAASSSRCSARRPGTRPGAAAAQMVDAICLDQKRVLPVHRAARGRVRGRRPLHGRPRPSRGRRASRRS